MGQRSPTASVIIAVIALVLLPAVSNVQANTLPASWAPHLWLTWPAGLALAAPLVYLDVRQRQRERHVAEGVGLSAEAQKRVDSAAQALAQAVRRQWTQEKWLRLLDHPVQLRVRWATTTRPVASPLANVVASRELSARLLKVRGDGPAQMVAVLGAVRDHQLVVLGEPGAGKSVLALLFVLELLDINKRQAGGMVPVLLTLSSWNPHVEDLHDWLARRITEEYPALGDAKLFGAYAPRALVTRGRILAVLDGLDEMPTPVQPHAIEALERAAALGQPMVVTCRTAQYEAAVTKGKHFLSRAAVLEIQPLEPAAVGAFLMGTRPDGDNRWRPVVEELHAHPGAPLARVLTSPLMVSLVRTVYGASDSLPGELLDHARFTESGIIEHHLLNVFVQAAYRRASVDPASPSAPGRLDYPSAQAQQWLVFLARHLDRLGTGDLAWWRLADAMPRIALALFNGLPVGLLFGVANALAYTPSLVVLILAVVYGSAAAFSCAFARPPTLARVQLRFHGTAKRFLAILAGGGTAGIGLTLALRQPVFPAIVSGSVIGLAFASRTWLDVPIDAAQAPTPRIALRQDRTASLALALTMAVAFGLVGGVGFTMNSRLSYGGSGLAGQLLGVLGGAAGGAAAGYVGYKRTGAVAFGLAGAATSRLTYTANGPAHPLQVGVEYGIVFGLAAGMAGLLSRAWGQFTLARLWLALRGSLPWQFMRFLHDAHQRGVLRQSGAVYEFRHAKLRDHLTHTSHAVKARRHPPPSISL